jgi:hypothetical protein
MAPLQTIGRDCAAWPWIRIDPLMSDIYRAAITAIRKQPYIDRANDDGSEEGIAFPAADLRTVHLVSPSGSDVTAADLIDEFWQDIFEEELAAWSEDDAGWQALTIE